MVNETVVEGYFYKKTTGEADGKNKKYNGTSKKANGAIRWDGFDFAAKGFNHVKAVDCGIRISETLFNSFKAAWSDDLINRYSSGKYTKFSDNFKAGDHKATGRNKGCICYEASAVEGLTMFWKKTDDPSFTGGYF